MDLKWTKFCKDVWKMKRKASDGLPKLGKEVKLVTSDDVSATKPHLSSGIVSRIPPKRSPVVLLDSSSDDELIIPKQTAKVKKNDSTKLNNDSTKLSLSGRCYHSKPNVIVLEGKTAPQQYPGSNNNNPNVYDIFQPKKQSANDSIYGHTTANTSGIISSLQGHYGVGIKFDCEEDKKLYNLRIEAAGINQTVAQYKTTLEKISRDIRKLNKQKNMSNPVLLTDRENDSAEHAISVVFPNSKSAMLPVKCHVAVDSSSCPLWSLAQQSSDFDAIAAGGLIDESKHRSVENEVDLSTVSTIAPLSSVEGEVTDNSEQGYPNIQRILDLLNAEVKQDTSIEDIFNDSKISRITNSNTKLLISDAFLRGLIEGFPGSDSWKHLLVKIQIVLEEIFESGDSHYRTISILLQLVMMKLLVELKKESKSSSGCGNSDGIEPITKNDIARSDINISGKIGHNVDLLDDNNDIPTYEYRDDSYMNQKDSESGYSIGWMDSYPLTQQEDYGITNIDDSDEDVKGNLVTDDEHLIINYVNKNFKDSILNFIPIDLDNLYEAIIKTVCKKALTKDNLRDVMDRACIFVKLTHRKRKIR